MPVVALVTVQAAGVALAEKAPDAAAALLDAAATIRGADDPTDPVTRRIHATLTAQGVAPARAPVVANREAREQAIAVLTGFAGSDAAPG